MSFEFHYFFQSPSPLHDIVGAFKESLSVDLRLGDNEPNIYVGRVLAMEFRLTHNFVDEDLPGLNEYPYELSAKIWSAESDLLFIQPSLFFSMIYMMYRRMGIKKGVWGGDSLQRIAEYDYVCGDQGWQWYDLTNSCIAGNVAEHVEDYLIRVFPRGTSG